MNPVSPSISRHVPGLVLIAALAALVWCAVTLLVSVASGDVATVVTPADGPLLAPFRWAPLARNLG